MNTILFPANKLNVKVCKAFNGHKAAISFNTDRLKDGKYALAELEAFRNDFQLTSFLNPRYSNTGENVNYGETLKKLDSTGRWSWGVYFNTNSWLNPFTQVVELIPGYGLTTWSQSAADFYNAHGASITVGSAKVASFPNHGINLFTLTNGHMGFDDVNGLYGSETQGRETIDWLFYQINVFVQLFGKRVTAISYQSGIYGSIPIMSIPYIFAARNSVQSISGDSNINYQDLVRVLNNNRPSNTRTWDAIQAGQLTESDSIAYTKSQIQHAIDNEGFFTDFAHIHSFYEKPDLPFIPLFYSQMRSQVGNQDIWNCGFAEAFEYSFLRDSLRKIGSFQHDNDLYFFYHIKDEYKGTFTNVTVSNDLDFSLLKMPISFEIDTTGTYLAGKNIKCDEAILIRSLGLNKWVISVPYRFDEEGYAKFRVYEGNGSYYSATKPAITRTGNVVSTDLPTKLVIWRKPTSGGLADITEVFRDNELKTSFNYLFELGYTYYIGAITHFNHSSLMETII